MRRARAWLWRGATVVLLLAVPTACSASRYELLSFFFDGVPDPNAPQPKVAAPVLPLVKRTVNPDAPPPVKLTMHQPYAEQKCDACHRGAGDKSKQRAGAFAIGNLSQLVMPIEQLCLSCHAPRPDAFQHAPALLGDCVRCHNPHSSKADHLLQKADVAALCAPCHTTETMPTREAHAAYGERSCAECHDPHSSSLRYLLRPAAATAAPPPPAPRPEEPDRQGDR